MNENTLNNFIFVLRSMNFYGVKKPPVQYTQTTYNAWLANHANEETEIKKTHPNFGFRDIPMVTLEYFEYKLNNNKVFERHDNTFLNVMGNLDIFVDSDGLEDIKFDLQARTNHPNMINTASPQGLENQLQNMRISSKINVEKLSGADEDISEWFDTFERLATAEG